MEAGAGPPSPLQHVEAEPEPASSARPFMAVGQLEIEEGWPFLGPLPPVPAPPFAHPSRARTVTRKSERRPQFATVARPVPPPRRRRWRSARGLSIVDVIRVRPPS